MSCDKATARVRSPLTGADYCEECWIALQEAARGPDREPGALIGTEVCIDGETYVCIIDLRTIDKEAEDAYLGCIPLEVHTSLILSGSDVQWFTLYDIQDERDET